jgi:hypothetical protein
MLGKVGKAIGRASGKARDWLKKQHAKLKERYQKWKEKRKKNAEKRLEEATAAFDRMFDQGVPKTFFQARLLWLRIRYGVRISVSGTGDDRVVTLQVNPKNKRKLKVYRKKLHGGKVKVLSVSPSPQISDTSLRIIDRAYKDFNRHVRDLVAKGEKNASTIGRIAGRKAEQSLKAWAKREGIRGLRVGDVLLGPGHGKHSSDVRYALGSMILDFKLSTTSTRAKQQGHFIEFMIDSGFITVLISARKK